MMRLRKSPEYCIYEERYEEQRPVNFREVVPSFLGKAQTEDGLDALAALNSCFQRRKQTRVGICPALSKYCCRCSRQSRCSSIKVLDAATARL
jgi:hypothetical protein